MRPLRSLVPARFICLSTMLKCVGKALTLSLQRNFSERPGHSGSPLSQIRQGPGMGIQKPSETIRNQGQEQKTRNTLGRKTTEQTCIHFLNSFLSFLEDNPADCRSGPVVSCCAQVKASSDWMKQPAGFQCDRDQAVQQASCIEHHCTRCPVPASLAARTRPQHGFISISPPSNT